jgi:hypothetical protein
MRRDNLKNHGTRGPVARRNVGALNRRYAARR